MPVSDDTLVFVIRRDISGGANSRQFASNIGETQCSLLYNADIDVPGESRKRPGLTLVDDVSSSAGTGLFGFEPLGGTNNLLSSFSASAFGNPTAVSGASAYKSDFTVNSLMTFIKATCSGTNGDVVLLSNGTDNVFEMRQNHTMVDCGDINTSCPKTTVLTFYRNRVWALKNNLLYWSDALPATYSASAFDRTTNNFKISVGFERAIIGLRDQGLVCLGSDAVYGINPSITPAATDKPEKILDIGCVAGKTACQVGDDILFLATDGVRGVFRTQQDKLQLGQSFPLSYPIKNETDLISWSNIDKACAIYFDGKYFISLPTSGSSYNNQVWIYRPATQGWIVVTGWNVAAWAKMKVNGEERLFAVDSTDGLIYRAWYGTSDNGTSINYQEEGRAEDLGNPLVKKYGGEICVRAAVSGNYDIDVSADFDNSGYQFVGKVNLGNSSFVTFPTTFPISFPTQNVIIKKFPIDKFGEWYQIKLRLQQNTAVGATPIKIYERSIVSMKNPYESEEV